jgi:hypothetical protein
LGRPPKRSRSSREHGSVAGPDNSPANGNGTIDDVFAAAATFWEELILDPVTLTVQYRWEDTASALAAYDGTTIGVSALNPWFVDATPLLNEKFTTPEYHLGTVNGTTLNYSLGLSGGNRRSCRVRSAHGAHTRARPCAQLRESERLRRLC